MFHLPHMKPRTLTQRKAWVLKQAHVTAHLTYCTAVFTHYGFSILGVAAGGMGIFMLVGEIYHVDV